MVSSPITNLPLLLPYNNQWQHPPSSWVVGNRGAITLQSKGIVSNAWRSTIDNEGLRRHRQTTSVNGNVSVLQFRFPLFNQPRNISKKIRVGVEGVQQIQNEGNDK